MNIIKICPNCNNKIDLSSIMVETNHFKIDIYYHEHSCNNCKKIGYNFFITGLTDFINSYSNVLDIDWSYEFDNFPKEFKTPEVELILKLI